MADKLVNEMTQSEWARVLRVTAHRLSNQARHGQTGGAAVECGVLCAIAALCKTLGDALEDKA